MSSWHHGSDVHNVKSPRLLSVRDSEEKIVALCTDIDKVKLIAAAPDLLEALKVAEQFMNIASDWNLDEAEINGEMRSTYDWIDLVRSAISKSTGSAA